MDRKEISYRDAKGNMVGYLAYEKKEKRPAVIIFHAFEGRNSLACEYAEKVAELGYVGFAADFFGERKIKKDLVGCMDAITPFFEDRSLIRDRAIAAFKTVEGLEMVDRSRIAAIGFCFGGMCALDLARSGASVKGVVSVHGILKPPNLPRNKITAKVLALHGYKDPQISKEELEAFMKEMDEADVDWQLYYYGQAKHAFTDPKAREIGPKEMGREFNQIATERAWESGKNFFSKIFL